MRPARERRDRLTTLFRVPAAEPPDQSWTAVRDRLRPVLRPVTSGTTGQVGAAAAAPSGVGVPQRTRRGRPAEAMAYVVGRQLETWEVPAEAVFAAARADLAEPARRLLHRLASRFPYARSADREPARNRSTASR